MCTFSVVDLVNSKDNVPVGDELSANLQSHLGVRFGLASHKSWPAPQQGFHQTTCWQKLAHKHASGGHWDEINKFSRPLLAK